MLVICVSPGIIFGKTFSSPVATDSTSTFQSGTKRSIESTDLNSNTNPNPDGDEDGDIKRSNSKKRVRIDEGINTTQEVPGRVLVDGDSVKDHYNQLSRKEVQIQFKSYIKYLPCLI